MGTMWGPLGCGDHMGTTWRQHGDHRDVETTWGQHGDNMGTTGIWRPCGDNMETTWGQHEDNVETILGQHGDRQHVSSIGYRHSRLSSFGTSNFFKKNVCTRTGIFLFVIFAAPVPTCGSCCFIRVTSPSLYWVLVLVFDRSIEGKKVNPLMNCSFMVSVRK